MEGASSCKPAIVPSQHARRRRAPPSHKSSLTSFPSLHDLGENASTERGGYRFNPPKPIRCRI